MYDINVALRRFRPLIRWTAWRYFRTSVMHNQSSQRAEDSLAASFKLSVEDLEAEGLLCLVKCCQQFPKGEMQFARYFKKSWYEKLHKLFRDANRNKRRGWETGLRAAELLSHDTSNDEFVERMEGKIAAITPLVSPNAAKLLRMLIKTPGEVDEYAWREHCRRKKLQSQGIESLRYKKFRIKSRHLHKALGMNSAQVREVIKEIQSVNKNMRWRMNG